ncbi:unnamed protein product, partial [Nesidiocoris tenuis]
MLMIDEHTIGRRPAAKRSKAQKIQNRFRRTPSNRQKREKGEIALKNSSQTDLKPKFPKNFGKTPYPMRCGCWPIINSAVHSSAGLSPTRLFLGREVTPLIAMGHQLLRPPKRNRADGHLETGIGDSESSSLTNEMPVRQHSRQAFSSTFGTLTDFYSGIISSALSTEPVKCANLALENNFLFSLNYPLLSCGALR